jgi:PEP-CTERM motif
MKQFIKLSILSASLATAVMANAATIQLQTGYSASGPLTTAEEYRSVVEAAIATPGAGYGSTTVSSYDNVSNHGLFGSSTNIAFKATINFGVAAGSTGNYSFRAGVDFGRGGAVFLDGQAVDLRTNDMWWAGSYNNPSQFFQFSANIGAGNHTLTMYGLEGCCDGGQQMQFDSGSGFRTIDNTTLPPVPEPETYAMMLAGLGLLGWVGRRKAKQQLG